MTNFITAVSNRRTNYTLSKDVTIPQETVTKTIEDVIREVPSAFNMQSGIRGFSRTLCGYCSALFH